MQLRGEIVEKAVREIGVPLAEVARRMKKSRRHIYNMFENPRLSLDEILQIGKIIHYDFTLNTQLFTNNTEHLFTPFLPRNSPNFTLFSIVSCFPNGISKYRRYNDSGTQIKIYI